MLLSLKLHPRTISRSSKKGTWLIEQHKKGALNNYERHSYAKFPATGNVLIEFIRFGKAEMLPINSWLIKERARQEAETLDILNFHASRGWVKRMLRRFSVHTSF